jgi:hypothetical protein
MKSEEIINQFKTILGLEAKAPEQEIKVVEEEVVLAEEAKEEPKAESKEEVKEGAAPQMAYVSYDEFSKVVASLTAMVEQAMESINAANANSIPQGMSKDEPKVELAKEDDAKEFVHDPEAVVEKKSQILHSQSRKMTTEDRVFRRLFGN